MALRVRVLGIGLILLSAFVIAISFGIIFLGLDVKLAGINFSPIIIKVINFSIILIFFIFLAYVGYIMAFQTKE